MTADERDRITKLEVELHHMSAKVNKMAEQMEEMHDLLQQAKGAKYFIVFAAGVGGFIASKAATILGIFGGSLPK